MRKIGFTERRAVYGRVFLLALTEAIFMFILPNFVYFLPDGIWYELGFDAAYALSLLLPPILLLTVGEKPLPERSEPTGGGGFVALTALGLIALAAIFNYYVLLPFTSSGIIYVPNVDMPADSTENLIYTVISTVLIPAFCEEFFFRGAILRRLAPLGGFKALVLSALLFALFHANLGQMLYAFVAGIIFGYVALLTGNIMTSVLLHLVNNGISVAVSYAQSHFGDDFAAMLNGYIDVVLYILIIIGIIGIAVKSSGCPGYARLKQTGRVCDGVAFHPVAIPYFLLMLYEIAVTNLPVFY